MTIEPSDHVEQIARAVAGAIGLVTEEVAARVLEIEPSTLATWRSQGRGPNYVKLGKGVFYTVASLSVWVNTELSRQSEERKVVQAPAA